MSSELAFMQMAQRILIMLLNVVFGKITSKHTFSCSYIKILCNDNVLGKKNCSFIHRKKTFEDFDHIMEKSNKQKIHKRVL